MKQISLPIILLLLLPVLGMAQLPHGEHLVSFYEHLAERDALYEQRLSLVKLEDQKDFWKDQANFEQLLLEKNPRGYRIYLKNKGKAYRLHQKNCQASCQHSEHYFRKAAYYSVQSIVKGEFAFASDIKKTQSND